MDPVQSSIKVYGGINLQRIKIDTEVNNNIVQSRNDYGKWSSQFVIESEYNSGQMVNASFFTPGLLEGVSSMSFYKKTPSQKYYNLVTDSKAAMYIMDYNVRNYEYYHYMVALTRHDYLNDIDNVIIYENKVDKETGELTGYGEYNQYLKTQWDSWSICDIEQSNNNENTYMKVGDIWKLKYNISEESLNQNLNVTVWDTLSRYSKISRGQKDFVSSTFTGLLGDIEWYKDYKNEQAIIKNEYTPICGYTEKTNGWDNPYATEMNKLRAWLEFCSNGKLKLLKDYKGNSWVVQIIGNPNNNIDIKSNLQETLISFEWQEVLDVSKISIVRTTPVENDRYNEVYSYSS